jgi:hypothetical protein
VVKPDGVDAGGTHGREILVHTGRRGKWFVIESGDKRAIGHPLETDAVGSQSEVLAIDADALGHRLNGRLRSRNM